MGWISDLLDKLSVLWPFVRIQVWQRAIRTTFLPSLVLPTRQKPYYRTIPPRAIVASLGPGVHRRLWWMEEVQNESIVEQVYNLPTQSITTKDDVAVTFSANIRFQISDVVLNLTQVHNFEASLEGAAMVHLAQRVRDWNWKELVENQKKLEKSLADTLTTRVKHWGVEIIDVGLTDLVKGRVYRFYGDSFKA